MMPTFTTLSRRLNEARKPDRGLDRDLARLVTGRTPAWWHPSAWGAGVPHYTRSFEAALTLLPAMLFVEVSAGFDTYQAGVWPAVSLRWLPPGETDPKRWHGEVKGAPTFALAMCRAAVEARARMASYKAPARPPTAAVLPPPPIEDRPFAPAVNTRST